MAKSVIVAVVGAAFLAAEAGADAVRLTPEVPEATCLPGDAAEAKPETGPPILLEGLGHAGVEADSGDAEARAWFSQGARLVWAFDEAEAVRAFHMAQRADPTCAMCYWGEAWARGPTINLQPRSDELTAARAAAEKAAALGAGLGPRDRALIEAMLVRTGGAGAFQSEAYANAMEAATRRFPADDLVAVLAADARMSTKRGDFRPGSFSQRLLEGVLRRNPDHGGAIHFYIHLTDWIDRQHLAEPYADRLAGIAPEASHLIHMPSHTFYGVGRYADAAAANVAAIAADRAYEDKVKPPPTDYRTGLYTHNMHFAINSALMRGDGATALAITDHCMAKFPTPKDDPAWRRTIRSATWFARGLHGDPEAVLAIAEPANAFEKAMRLYARGEAQARLRDAAGVRAEAAALEALRTGTEAPALGSRGGADLVEIAQQVLEGRAAMLAGDFPAAQAAYRKAMTLQLGAGFSSDPPLWWFPVRRSLGAAYLAAGDNRRAKAQLEASLKSWPNDPLALAALARAERALGRARAAEMATQRARGGWLGDLNAIPLGRI
jgi:hypothetical protein